MNELEITLVENGFILTEYIDDGKDSYPKEKVRQVFEILDQEETQVFAAQRLLQTIVDKLGLTGSRYDKHRLYIKLEPGDKYEDFADGNV